MQICPLPAISHAHICPPFWVAKINWIRRLDAKSWATVRAAKLLVAIRHFKGSSLPLYCFLVYLDWHSWWIAAAKRENWEPKSWQNYSFIIDRITGRKSQDLLSPEMLNINMIMCDMQGQKSEQYTNIFMLYKSTIQKLIVVIESSVVFCLRSFSWHDSFLALCCSNLSVSLHRTQP